MSATSSEDDLPAANSTNSEHGSESDSESTSNSESAGSQTEEDLIVPKSPTSKKRKSASQIEEDLVVAKSGTAKKRKSGIRNPTNRPSGCWEVDEIHPESGAPMEPEPARRKFQTVCGYVARDRVNINIKNWKQFDGVP